MKKCFSFVLLAIFAVGLCGCSKNPFSSDASENSESREDTVSMERSETSEQDSSSESSSEAHEESKSSAEAESKETAPQIGEQKQLEWSGVYLYGGEDGEVLIVRGVSDDTVYGTYIFITAVGDYGAREFSWALDPDDPYRASELFQNGVDHNFFELDEDRIRVDYPDGSWEDRDYLYFCPVEQEDRYPAHPYLSQLDGSSEGGEAHEPFYGVWVVGTHDPDEAQRYADALQDAGFDGAVYVTTDWSNLNTEHWYVVSAGEFKKEEEAEKALSKVHSAGWQDAYVKYTGDWQG